MRNLIAAAVASVMLFAGAAAAQSPPSGTATAGPFTVSAEALLWWFKSSPTPVPLVADGAFNDPDFPAKILLGGDERNTNPNPGFRFTAGYAPGGAWGVEGSVLYILPRSSRSSVASSGQPGSADLIIPYIDAITGRETGGELSLAPNFRGEAHEELKNSLVGAELNATWALTKGPGLKVSLLGGFRWLRLRETYTITTSSPFIPPQPIDVWDTTDKFDAFNNFYGAQLGARARYDWGPWFVNASLKVGFGAMRQTVEIDGSLVSNDFSLAPLTPPGQPAQFGAPQKYIGGYWALPSNIGEHNRTVFAVVPEAGLNVGYQITPSISVFLGYTFLYINDVARPGNQVSRTINTTQNVAWVGETALHPEGPAQPSFKFKSSDFWAQGLNVGLGFRF